MAKYDIKFSCGHTKRIELYGKVKKRLQKIEYFERVELCRECYFAQQEIKNKKEGKKNG